MGRKVVKFTDLFYDDTKSGVKLSTDNYLESGKYQIIDQGKNEVAGYTNREEGVYTNTPAIIFGDHTRIIKHVSKPFFLGADGVKLLKAKLSDVDYKYLYYALSSLNISDEGYSRHYRILKEMSIPLYPLAEQKHIVKVLDAICAIIQKRKQQIALLDDAVKSLFVEMFGDVIHNDKKWKEFVFSDVAESRLGKMLDAKQQTGKCSFPYLANFNVQWFKFNLENLNRMDFDDTDRVEFSLEEGDLLVCEGGEIGRCAVWHNELQNCYFQKALHRVRCNREIIHPMYLAYWFKYKCDHNGFSTIAGAKATIAHLPGVKLKQLIVTVPPVNIQNEFADHVEKIETQKRQLEVGLTKMEEAYGALMQEYFG